MRPTILFPLAAFLVAPVWAAEPDNTSGVRAAVVFVGVTASEVAALRSTLEAHFASQKGPSILGRAVTETAVKALAQKPVAKASEVELANLRRELGVEGLAVVRKLGSDDREKVLVFQLRVVSATGEVTTRVTPVPVGDMATLMRQLESLLPRQRVDVADPPKPELIPGAAT
ncbi:MAG: hypothetical protein HY791_14580 [Deltaproteobacteria bacterium]|nr:hypothetical protein [Deltaproteobacteria bacterium]